MQIFPGGGTIEYYTVEHDKNWIDFFCKENGITDEHIVQLNLEKRKVAETRADVTAYVGFTERFKGERFDLISIDGPFGSDEISRIDILPLLPDCLSDDFIILMDDCQRVGEQNTYNAILQKLQENSIEYSTGSYVGEKVMNLICARKYGFLATQ